MPDDRAGPIDEPDYPYPPRFARLKRGLIIGGIVLALLIGLRLWWGYEAQRRYNTFVAAAHARGEKILLSDYLTGESLVPDERNAAVLLRRAATQVVYSQDERDWDVAYNVFQQRGLTGLPLSRRDRQMIAGIVKNNAQPLRLIRQARDMPELDWHIVPVSPAVNVLLPHLTELRELAKIARCAALHAHSVGHDLEAFEHIFDIEYQSQTATKQFPSTFSILVRNDIAARAAELTRDIAPELKVASDVDGAVKRQQVVGLIHELLDESELRPLLPQAWQAERMVVLDIGGYLNSQSVSGVGVPIAPKYLLDSLRLGIYYDRLIAATSEASNYPDSMTTDYDFAGWEDPPTIQFSTRVVSILFAHNRSGLHRAHYGLLAERRSAAIALALRLYQLDHGRLPERLEELVPEYLPQVPQDPFAADDRPLSYRADRQPPIIYSVGVDGVDDGGVASRQWGFPDAVFYYGPRPREPEVESDDPESDETEHDK